MGTKIFALFFLANICVVCPLQLTREIVPKNVLLEEIKVNPDPPTIKEIVQAVVQSSILDDLVSFIVENQAETILNLTEKIESNSENLKSIFDTLNEGLGANVLKVTNETLVVDISQLETFVLNQATNLAQALYGKDIFQQLIFYTIASEQVRTVLKDIKPELENIGVPLKVIAAVLPKIQSKSNDNILNRSISKRDAVTDLLKVFLNLFKTPICAVVTNVVTIIKTTLGVVSDNLTSAVVETANITNQYLQIAALAYNSLLTYLKDNIAYGLEVIDLAYSSTCSSSRKRRDLYEMESLKRAVSSTSTTTSTTTSPTSTTTTSTTPTSTTSATTTVQISNGNIFSTIYAFVVMLYTNFLAPILNTAFKGFVLQALKYVQGIVNSFLNTTVLALAYTIINTITLQS